MSTRKRIIETIIMDSKYVILNDMKFVFVVSDGKSKQDE